MELSFPDKRMKFGSKTMSNEKISLVKDALAIIMHKIANFTPTTQYSFMSRELMQDSISRFAFSFA